MEDSEFLNKKKEPEGKRNRGLPFRSIVQLFFFLFFVFSIFLTYHYIRLGIIGMLMSTFVVLAIQYNVTKKTLGFWRKLRYWQKGAIIFGVIHLIVFIINLMPYESFGKLKEGQIAYFFLEYPLLLILGIISLIIPLFQPLFLFKYKVGYYSIIIWGTLAYAIFGALFGLAIDGIFWIKARAERRAK